MLRVVNVLWRSASLWHRPSQHYQITEDSWAIRALDLPMLQPTFMIPPISCRLEAVEKCNGSRFRPFRESVQSSSEFAPMPSTFDASCTKQNAEAINNNDLTAPGDSHQRALRLLEPSSRSSTHGKRWSPSRKASWYCATVLRIWVYPLVLVE